jgi:hypothetical protein
MSTRTFLSSLASLAAIFKQILHSSIRQRSQTNDQISWKQSDFLLLFLENNFLLGVIGK